MVIRSIKLKIKETGALDFIFTTNNHLPGIYIHTSVWTPALLRFFEFGDTVEWIEKLKKNCLSSTAVCRDFPSTHHA